MLIKICKVLAPIAVIVTVIALIANVIDANWHYVLVLSVLLVANVNGWIAAYHKD